MNAAMTSGRFTAARCETFIRAVCCLSQTTRALVLLAGLGAWPALTPDCRASLAGRLEGQSKGDPAWFGGPVRNWSEDDSVPVRVALRNGPGKHFTATVDFDHTKGLVTPGIQDLVGFTTSGNVRITAGPTLLQSPTRDKWSYAFTVDVTDDQDGYVEFRARLSVGCHQFHGSSLALGGAPLGTLQIMKPAARSASPEPTVSICTPPNGSIFVRSQPITVVTYARFPGGCVTNLVLATQSEVLARTTTAPQVFAWNNAPLGASELIAQAQDSLGTPIVSAPVSFTVLERPPITASPAALNPSTRFFEQTILVSNPTPLPFGTVRVWISNLPPGVTVRNADGESSGVPFVLIIWPVDPGQTASLVLQYESADTQAPPSPTLVSELVIDPAKLAPVAARIERISKLEDGGIALEFTAPRRRTCYIEYSTDLTTWRTAQQPVTAAASGRTSWIDVGPPYTEAHPRSRPARFYRLLIMPGLDETGQTCDDFFLDPTASSLTPAGSN